MASIPIGLVRRAIALPLGVLLLYLLLSPRLPQEAAEVPDYWAHFGAFGLWVWIFWTFRPGRAAWPLVVSAIALGVAVELIQPFVGRSGSPRDALANAVGALLAGGLIVLRRRTRPRRG